MKGRRLVLLVAAGIVAVSAVVGGTVPLILPAIGAPKLFGLLALPPTVPGYALYGAATTAVLLAIGLVAVEAASRAE